MRDNTGTEWTKLPKENGFSKILHIYKNYNALIFFNDATSRIVERITAYNGFYNSSNSMNLKGIVSKVLVHVFASLNTLGSARSLRNFSALAKVISQQELT